MTAPSIRSQTTSSTEPDTTTHTVTLPSTVNSGDILLVLFTIDGAPTITWDQSSHGTWTQLFQETRGTAVRSQAWYKTADGTEDGGSLGITSSSSETSVHQSFSIQNTSAAPQAATANQGTSSANPPNLAPSWGTADTLWFAFVGWASGIQDANTYPTNYTNGTKLNTAGDLAGVGNATAQRTTTASSEDPGSFTMSATISVTVATIGFAGDTTVTAATLTVTPELPAASIPTTASLTAVTLTVTPTQPQALVGSITNVTAVTLTVTPTQPQATLSGQNSLLAATLNVTPSAPRAQALGGAAAALGSWTMDIQGPNGGANIATDVPFRMARITWAADGPGAAEIVIRDDTFSSDWKSGLHRVVINLDGAPMFAGYNNRLERSGPPGAVEWKVSVNGLSWILDKRIVRGAYTIEGTVAQITESLLDNAQEQLNGEMGFTMGTVTGTTVTRYRSYCFGVIIGDAIRELAQIGRGFDWEIDASGNLNVWNNTRGVDTGLQLTETSAIDFQVVLDTVDMTTTVSALGEPGDPFGPRHDMVRSTFADSYGRRETIIDVPTTKNEELIDAATQELKANGGASFEVLASWIEGRGPWSFGDVWLQDEVQVVIPGLNETYDMRCTDITLTLDPTPEDIWFIEQRFQALVVDITEGDPDDVEESA